MANGFNPLASFQQGLALRQGMQDQERQNQLNQLRDALSQQAGQAGFDPNQSLEMQQLAALDPTGASRSLATFQAIGQDRQKAFFQDARKARRMLDAGDTSGFLNLVEGRLAKINAVGGDPSDTMAVLNAYAQGDVEGVKSMLGQVEMQGVEDGMLTDLTKAADKTPAMREFDSLVRSGKLTPQQAEKAARIKLGLEARAVGSAAQTISADQKLTQDVAISQAAIEGAKEGAKLTAQFKLKPRVERAVSTARAESKFIADQNKEQKSNQKAMLVYDTAYKTLADAMGQTTTGPIVGLIPALTAEAQSADGAVSMILPTLKDVFRSAGEGTFTDSDQKILTDMIPTRRDAPKARAFKLQAIDAIIRAKLGGGEVQQPANPAQRSEQDILSQYGL